MKKIYSFILIIAFLVSLSCCEGNLSSAELKDVSDIPENGIIEKSVLDELKDSKAIGTFRGWSDDIKYEWIIFGRELESTSDINLLIDTEKTEKGIKLFFSQEEPLAFNAFLSLYLNERWEGNASAVKDGREVYSVSVTGSENSILNLSVKDIHNGCEIIPVAVNDKEETSHIQSSESEIEDDEGATEDFSSADESSKPSETSEESIEESREDSREDSKEESREEEKIHTCTISVECTAVFNNLQDLDKEKLAIIPSDGIILPPTRVEFSEGETVFDVLKSVCRDNKIPIEYSFTPLYNSSYIEGIGNLYEMDCGPLSGWVCRVDGSYLSAGFSAHTVSHGEKIEVRYTCDLGRDVGEEGVGSK